MDVLSELVVMMPTLQKRTNVLKDLLDVGTLVKRSSLLQNFGAAAPVIKEIGGHTAIRKIIRIISDAAEWWP